MLETIREFAWEQLAASGEEEETRRRHAMWCLALAERCNIRDRASDDVRLRLDRLEAERDNLRAAMAWLLDSGEIETALCLGTKLHYLWTNRGPASEGRAWLKRALATPGNHPASPAIRGLAAQTASILAWMEGAFDEAATLAGEALALAREGSVEADAVWALNLLGMAATSLGHYDEAAAHLDAALALYRKLGAGRGVVSHPHQPCSRGGCGARARLPGRGARPLSPKRRPSHPTRHRPQRAGPSGLSRRRCRRGGTAIRRKSPPLLVVLQSLVAAEGPGRFGLPGRVDGTAGAGGSPRSPPPRRCASGLAPP